MSLPSAEAETVDSLEAQECKSTAIPPKKHTNWWLAILYSTFTAIGLIGMPLLQRVYFTHGGSSKWLATLLQSVGFFIIALPLPFLYFKSGRTEKLVFFMDPKLFLSSACIGLVAGFNNWLYSAGLSSIPASTSSLLLSSQLAFNSLFSFIIVRQKITFYSLNSVVVVTCGVVVLALHTSGDQPLGETRNKYLLGFFFTLAAAALQGLTYPLVELAYNKSTKPMNSPTVLQFQFIMGLFATLFSSAGMLISNDYKNIAKEAGDFRLGETKYYLLIVATLVVAECVALGVTGLISCTSSLFAGIVTAVNLPMTEVASIITFGEKFNGQKGLSLVLCLWGFTSYFIGEHKKSGKTEPVVELSNVNEVKDSGMVSCLRGL